MPGALKNALDWLVGSGELFRKPVVVVSAAPSTERGHNARRWVSEVVAAIVAARHRGIPLARRHRGLTETGDRPTFCFENE